MNSLHAAQDVLELLEDRLCADCKKELAYVMALVKEQKMEGVKRELLYFRKR